jgi:hypothetical protein
MMFLVGQLARVHLCGKHYCFEVLRVVELFEVRTTKRKVRKPSLEMTKVVLCTTKNVSLELLGYRLSSQVPCLSKSVPWILLNVLIMLIEDVCECNQ